MSSIFGKGRANKTGTFQSKVETVQKNLGLKTDADYRRVFWPPISNALTREKAKEISKSVFPFSRTF